ncbi:arginase [Enterococcus florum]|uniref:Arginase n=1 Tax=Enterococcus florum TaxID=2480627 RepID=A0A4V0WPY6_9ENTE|nr:arginase family protein [Enterococcus florum]GCF95489.1 arginase [Enterococcus florum]
MTTIRLKVPQWQGGNKPNYFFGSQLLSWLAPENPEQKEFEVPIPEYNGPLQKENGVVGLTRVAATIDLVTEIITKEAPDKIITLGGDCLVSQAPFDYLKGKYGEELGVIWIDSHPDISTPEIYHHAHAMVLGNLFGHGDPFLSKKVENPFSVDSVLFVGLQEPTKDEKRVMQELALNYQVQNEVRISPKDIKQWVAERNFSKLVVHFDLDVLDPNTFRSLYFTEPGVKEFPSESGKMSLMEVEETMKAISEASDIVGLTIAEYLPWDAANLKKLMNSFNIFF